MTIQKKIWFLWLNGKENMPEIIEHCFLSWKKHNDDWDIVFLSRSNIENYLNSELFSFINSREISPVALADIIRINLLNDYGGVWVDSTTYCCKPLNKWLPGYLDSGFFAFESPENKFTLISSWFLASKKNNYIVERYCQTVNDYWYQNPDLKLYSSIRLIRYFFKLTLLIKYMDRHPQKWFAPLFLKFLKIHPYYWLHYLFEKLVIEDTDFAVAWKKCKKISSDIPHKLQFYGLTSNITDLVKEELKNNDAPLFKLNRRVGLNNRKSIINYLFNNG